MWQVRKKGDRRTSLFNKEDTHTHIRGNTRKAGKKEEKTSPKVVE